MKTKTKTEKNQKPNKSKAEKQSETAEKPGKPVAASRKPSVKPADKEVAAEAKTENQPQRVKSAALSTDCLRCCRALRLYLESSLKIVDAMLARAR